MIRILIDSGIDQNNYMKKTYDYDFLPLSVIINERDYLDQVELSLEDVHGYMKEGILPKTSQVSPKTVIDTLDACRERGEDVIYITIYSQFSGTYQVAQTTAEAYLEKYPNMNIAVIDSKGGSGGGALLALQAMEMAKKNEDFETIVSQTIENTEHIKYHFTLNNLKWLVKGGRLPKAAGYAGDALNIKPYLSVNETGIYLKKLVRGQDRIYKRMIKDVKKGIDSFTDQLVTISHVNDIESAKRLEKMVQEELPDVTTQIFDIGAVLAAHLGIGGVGVFYFDQKPSQYMYIEE
ncbi:DegV family protein [Alkalibacterium thalassium]|uniref:EDD domain protein, DegV family n=1 Tax=Alkalibacterium thalassium TaxID=426701 RepID=A0A1G9CHJ9_9LACT|nr:DegV family protein [Alkalibacterium thalassium]SDK50964.1 EDD domain protein, DegV family [Alkalibacterium thalassium]